ncbi:MAG: cytochrome P450 [Rhizobiaceae bacterium]
MPNKFRPPYPVGRAGPYQNFIFLRTLAQVPTIVRNPLEAYAKFQFLTPVSRYKLFSLPFALISDPDLIHHIFVERAADLEAEPIRQRILKPILRDGLLTAEGDVWKRTRRAIAPVFSPRHVNNFAEPMRRTTHQFLEELTGFRQGDEIAPALSRLTYLVLSETLFSGEIIGDTNKFLADVAHFITHMSGPDPLDLMGAPPWVPRLTKLRGGAAIKRMRKVVSDTAAHRRKAIDQGKAVPDDFLTLLLRAGDKEQNQLSIEEIEDNIITFIAAGHETTARGLAWTLYLLAHDDEARKKAEKEADALEMNATPPQEWGNHLPWITACFEEAMRLFPPAPVILRRLTANIDHGDYQIPAGTNVFVSPWVLHRHETLWEDPSAFDPGRFYKQERDKINRYAYLPFGLGPRVCIGASFAMMEAQIILAQLLRYFRFDYSGNKKPWPLMKITIQPDNGIPMKLTPRTKGF